MPGEMKRIANLSDEELLERWRSRIETAKSDFYEVAEGQHRFEQLVEVVRGNSRLQEIGGPFLDWIFRSHAHASVVAVRRHADGLGNDLSLDTLLVLLCQFLIWTSLSLSIHCR
jgi:hypothetical protein